jgi:hypothetical protein
MAEILIELSETELDAVAGGAGSASFSFSNTASGTTATVSGKFTQSTTAKPSVCDTWQGLHIRGRETHLSGLPAW